MSSVKFNSMDYYLLHSTHFRFAAMLQCISPICWSTPRYPLPKRNADFVQNFWDSRKKFICTFELLSLEVVFEMRKQENKKKPGGGKSGSYGVWGYVVDVGQFARN
jgi:hypothetical protein